MQLHVYINRTGERGRERDREREREGERGREREREGERGREREREGERGREREREKEGEGERGEGGGRKQQQLTLLYWGLACLVGLVIFFHILDSSIHSLYLQTQSNITHGRN